MSNNSIISKKASIAKAVYYSAVPSAYIIVCTYMKVSALLWMIPITALAVLLYTIPFFGMQNSIKKENDINSIKPYILSDFLYALLPSCGISFFLSLGIYVFSDADLVWMFYIIYISAAVLIALYFWLSYYIFGTVYKKIKSKLDK